MQPPRAPCRVNRQVERNRSRAQDRSHESKKNALIGRDSSSVCRIGGLVGQAHRITRLTAGKSGAEEAGVGRSHQVLGHRG